MDVVMVYSRVVYLVELMDIREVACWVNKEVAEMVV